MHDAISDSEVDRRRSLGLLIGVAGLAAVSIGIAASPASASAGPQDGAPDMRLMAVIAPICSAAAVGYALHRELGREREAHPAAFPMLAYGATAALLLLATFGLAGSVHSALGELPGVRDVATGIIAGGLLVALAGALQWNHGAGGWRFAALGLLGWFLFVGWIVSASGGAWAAAWQDAPLSGAGAAFLALAVSGPPSGRSALKPDA